jgi:hypothetical protein
VALSRESVSGLRVDECSPHVRCERVEQSSNGRMSCVTRCVRDMLAKGECVCSKARVCVWMRGVDARGVRGVRGVRVCVCVWSCTV